MLKLAAIAATTLLATSLASLHVARAAESPTTAPSTQPAADTTPINKYCAVNTKDLIDPKVTTVYKGKTIAFCCEDCIKEFNKDPEKYASKAK
jgi:YHS domain-containing protein